MKLDWQLLQERIKELFINLGCETQSDISVQGVRTKHDVDVFVKSKYLGQPLQWIIEAKYWKTKVTKLHVMALRQIVDDIGADKGIIVTTVGFQSGALQAATQSNISLLTFNELKIMCSDVFHNDILKTYVRRLNYITNRYFSHSKRIRIDYGLRQDVHIPDGSFDVHFILQTAIKALKNALDNIYPIQLETYLTVKYGALKADNFYQIVNWLNQNLMVVEENILKAEIEMQQNKEFTPQLRFDTISENYHLEHFRELDD